jgi:hypothetical protein
LGQKNRLTISDKPVYKHLHTKSTIKQHSPEPFPAHLFRLLLLQFAQQNNIQNKHDFRQIKSPSVVGGAWLLKVLRAAQPTRQHYVAGTASYPF